MLSQTPQNGCISMSFENGQFHTLPASPPHPSLATAPRPGHPNMFMRCYGVRTRTCGHPITTLDQCGRE